MPYFTGLARVARKTGYPVVEVAGWKTRGHGSMGVVQTIVAHHTAGPKSGNYPSLATVRSGRPGLPGPLAHFGIGRDGTIYVIAAGLAWHAGAVRKSAYSNSHAIGIEAENTGLGEEWSVAQLDAYVKLCRALVDEFKLDVADVLGHKEICAPVGRKPDPNFSGNGFGMDTFRAAVKRGYWKAPAAVIKPTSNVKPKAKHAAPKKAPAKSWPDVDLASISKHNTASHKAWVALMAAVGYKDKDLAVALQKWLRKLGFYQGHIDGKFGRLSVIALQRFLRKKKLYKGAIDGKRGAMTIKAEIAYLNAQRKYVA